MTGFPDAPLIGPGTELQLTIDGDAVAHEDVVAETAIGPAAAVAAAELVDGLEVGEEAEALELDLALARAHARGENLDLAGGASPPGPRRQRTRRQYASIYRTFGDCCEQSLTGRPLRRI